MTVTRTSATDPSAGFNINMFRTGDYVFLSGRAKNANTISTNSSVAIATITAESGYSITPAVANGSLYFVSPTGIVCDTNGTSATQINIRPLSGNLTSQFVPIPLMVFKVVKN